MYWLRTVADDGQDINNNTFGEHQLTVSSVFIFLFD